MEFLNEKVDDIPLIVSYLLNKKVDVFFNDYLGNHGNQNSLSNGEVAVIWLAYILSEGDHRKTHVKEWFKSRQLTLESCLSKQEIDPNNFSDDRLTRLLYRCSQDNLWNALEQALAKETLSLIPIDMMLENHFENNGSSIIKGVFKLDSTAISGSHEITEDGLMQFGYSKDHRPDLPQTKLMYCSEGLTGCSMITEIDQGNINDDFMYKPVLKRMRSIFNSEGFLYCGDSKMSIHGVREDIARNKEFYLCPLQLSNSLTRKSFYEEWVKRALDGSEELIQIEKEGEYYGYGYEFEREQVSLDGACKWTERVLMVKSLGYFEGEKKIFKGKIDKAVSTIFKLKTKAVKTKEEATQLVQEKIKELKAGLSVPEELFEIEFEIEEMIKTYKRCEVRKSGARAGSYNLKSYRGIIKKVQINEDLWKACLEKIGWRAYVSNISEKTLTFSNAYLYYRKTQYVIEDGFHMLKSKPIGIRPLHVWREDQIKGLMRFMTLGVLILKLISLEIMIGLKKKKEVLIGLTAGQPKRKTEKPTTVSVLSYFYRSNITLTCVKIENQWKRMITPLPELCSKILEILGLSDEVYLKLTREKQ